MTNGAQVFQQMWVATMVITLVSAAALYLPRRTRTLDIALATAALASLSALLVLRWTIAGHPPLLGAFENTMFSSWSVALAVAITCLTAPRAARVALQRTLSPLVSVLLLAGLLFDATPAVMGAAERVWLGYVHGAIGWLGFALLLSATVVAGRVLWARDSETSPVWDWYLFRLLCVGFVGLTATMATGSLYSFLLFSDWYRWQIVETLAAALWLAYALVLHARLFFQWKDKRLAWATIGTAPLLISAYWIWAVFPGTYHYFGQLLR